MHPVAALILAWVIDRPQLLQVSLSKDLLHHLKNHPFCISHAYEITTWTDNHPHFLGKGSFGCETSQQEGLIVVLYKHTKN